MTTVINLFAGSGVGKSTCAAGLFAEMKQRGYHVELVTEYVKTWAWSGRTPNGFDQVYLFGKQASRESQLYNKVDFIITDSPLLLSGFYENYHLKEPIVLPAVINFLNYAQRHNVNHLNFFLKRLKKFDPRGRYENEQQARQIDIDMKAWLLEHQIPLIDIDTSDRDRVESIITYINTAPLKDIVEEDDN
jgi:GTPase SAR1 family protein